jgi:hypothetical protein
MADLAEHEAQQPVALLRDATQVVFPCRGRDARRQPDVAQHVLTRRKAVDGPAPAAWPVR